MTAREDPRWWILPPEDEDAEANAWKRLMRIARVLDEDQKDDKERMARCARLYDPTSEFVGAEIDLRVGPYPAPFDRATVILNIVQTTIDTIMSMVAKNLPRPAFLTEGANWEQARKAEELEKVIEGEFQTLEVYDTGVDIFRDAATVGLGCGRVDARDRKPFVERIIWDSLIVDQLEWLSGEGRQIHEIRFVDREVLKERYPEYAEEIELVSQADTVRRWTSYRQVEGEMIPVLESWHVRSSPDAKDGIHAVCIDGLTLLWEAYEKDHFPHFFLRWSKRTRGFWGISLAEQLAGIQNRINKINAYISQCHNMSNTYVLVQIADAALRVKASGGHVPLQVIPYKGTIKPDFVVPEAVPRELYEHLVYLVKTAYQIAGISEITSKAERPPFESAVALQTYADQETQRYSIIAQRYERMYMAIARRLVETLKEIMAEGDHDHATVWKSHNAMKKIKWSDVNVPEDTYVISIEASSLLSQTPAGKISRAIELGNSGLYDREELRKLIGHPDLERAATLDDAIGDHAERIVERLINLETPPPEVLDGLPQCIKTVTAQYIRLKDLDGVPEAVLDNFRYWIKTAVGELQTAAPPPPAPQGQMGPPPPGAAPPGGPPQAPRPVPINPQPMIAA